MSNNQPIRNTKAFIKSYLKSKSGVQALNRAPYRKKTDSGFEFVNRNNQMALAFQAAVQ